jgi:hypothetical protein
MKPAAETRDRVFIANGRMLAMVRPPIPTLWLLMGEE